MDENGRAILKMRIDRTMNSLEENNIKAFYVSEKKDVVNKVGELIEEGHTVGLGGSMTLFETGVIDLLRSGKYKFLDRYKENLTQEEISQIYRETFFADTYFCSTNAVTEDGELYNVDGNSNRVAAIAYGPKSVIIIVGYNKIVSDLNEAVIRVKKEAAPINTTRLNCNTYCRAKGECTSCASGNRDSVGNRDTHTLNALSEMTTGCNSPQRICCNYMISGFQRNKDRIKVIIVGEELGY